jgi:hypothetical protein
MNFKDLFVPRYLHSNPDVRLKFVENSADVHLLKQMTEKDPAAVVREAAVARVERLQTKQRKAA